MNVRSAQISRGIQQEMRPVPQDIRDLVSQAAARMDGRQSEIARNMSHLIAREVKHLDVDQTFLELLHASTDANVKTLIHVLFNHIPIEHLQPTTAAVEYALRLAQRDIPANFLVRAYNVGKDNFIEQLFPDVQALDCSAEEKFKVLHHMSAVVGRYIDWVSQYVFDVYEKERERWIGNRGNVRAFLVHDILSGRNIDSRGLEKETGYKIGLRHVGLVVWSVDAHPVPDELRRLEQVATKVSAVAGCSGPPLITAVDRGTAWAWLPFVTDTVSIDTAEVGRIAARTGNCRVALGLPGAGVTGFRRTHAQARAARQVAVASGSTAPALGFGEDGVAITSMLMNDMESTRAWVAEVLGPLAFDNETMRVLRETLRVFFLTGESYTETAGLMKLHRNTVKYRVTKALEERDTGIAPNRVDLAVALNVCHFLGPAVLNGSAGR